MRHTPLESYVLEVHKSVVSAALNEHIVLLDIPFLDIKTAEFFSVYKRNNTTVYVCHFAQIAEIELSALVVEQRCRAGAAHKPVRYFSGIRKFANAIETFKLIHFIAFYNIVVATIYLTHAPRFIPRDDRHGRLYNARNVSVL